MAKDTDLGVSQGYNCLLFAHTRGLETDWSGKRLGSPLHPGCPELTAPPVSFSFPKWTLPSSRKTLWCNISSKLWSCWHRSHPGARYEHFGCTEQLESSETVRKFSVWHHCLHHTTEIPLSNLPDFHKLVPVGQIMADYLARPFQVIAFIPPPPIDSCSEFNSWAEVSSDHSTPSFQQLKTPKICPARLPDCAWKLIIFQGSYLFCCHHRSEIEYLM